MAYIARSIWEPLLGQAFGAGAHQPKPLSATEIESIVCEVRKSGLAVTAGTPAIPGFGGLAAPVFDQEGRLQAVMTVVAPVSALVGNRTEMPAARELLRAAQALSRQIGFRAPVES